MHATVSTSDAAPGNFEWSSLDPAPQRPIDDDASLIFDVVTGPDGSLQWRITGESMPTEPLYTFATQETIRLRIIIDNPGRWMAHCHILEHAELGMMGEFVIE